MYLSGSQLLPLPHVGPMGMELSLAKRISSLLAICSTFAREFSEFRDDNEVRRGVGRLLLRGRAKSCDDPCGDKILAESKNRTRDLASA